MHNTSNHEFHTSTHSSASTATSSSSGRGKEDKVIIFQTLNVVLMPKWMG